MQKILKIVHKFKIIVATIILLIISVGYLLHHLVLKSYRTDISQQIEYAHDLFEKLLIKEIAVMYNTQSLVMDTKHISDLIRNQVYMSVHEYNNNGLGKNHKFLTIEELIYDIFGLQFSYSIAINKDILLSVGTLSHDYTSRSYALGHNNIMYINIGLDLHSKYAHYLDQKVKNGNMLIMAGLATLLLLVSVLAEYVRRLNIQLSKAESKCNGILEYIRTNLVYSTDSYRSSKSISADYFLREGESTEYLPFPIVSLEKEAREEFIIETLKVVKLINKYCLGFNATYNCPIKLDIVSDADTIMLSCHQSVFNQIVLSLAANIFVFHKGAKDERHVFFKFSEAGFECKSDGFRLNEELGKKYSQKIYLDTGNPFILNLNQTLGLIKRHNMKYEWIMGIEEGMSIQVQYDYVEVERDQGADVIKLDKFRDKR